MTKQYIETAMEKGEKKMTEYIDKKNIILDYSGLAKIAPNDFMGIAKYFADQIKAMPAADVAPVKHGRWIEKDKYTFGTFYDCSICGDRILDNGHSWNYCPNCGAKMRGSDDE